MKTKANLELVLEGRGGLIVRPSDYLAGGGEASLYRKGETVIKLYDDQQKMRRDRMVEKIYRLSRLKHPYIVSPQGLVFAKSGQSLGFYLPYVAGEALARVFTNDFRAREKFTDQDADCLVEGMRETVQAAHDFAAIMVDANELNWLFLRNKRGQAEPRVFDIDSWTLETWPASVIMPSIRDWQRAGFNEESDWFSWAVVTFQIYTGIHPYKGRLAPYKRGDLTGRMKDKASVFRPGVVLNAAVRDFSRIAPPLLDWYRTVFESDKREKPPSPFEKGKKIATANVVRQVVASGGELLLIERLYDGRSEPAERIFACGLIRTAKNRLLALASGRLIMDRAETVRELVALPDGWLIASEGETGIALSFVQRTSLKRSSLAFPFSFRQLLCSGQRLLAVSEQGLSEISINQVGRLLASVGQTWTMMPNASFFFEGLAVQNALGAAYLFLPIGERACAVCRTKELDGKQIVCAKAGKLFACLTVLEADGTYARYEFAFDQAGRSYQFWQGPVDTAEINMAILDRGVCATIVEDGRLDIFVPSSGAAKKISDKRISSEMRLQAQGERVLCLYQGSVFSLRLKR